MTAKLQNIIEKILRAGLMALVFILPFAVTPWTIFPFVFGKTLLLQSVVEILTALFLTLIIIEPKYRPRFDTLTKLIFAYLGIMIIASIFGADWHRSFWGTEERGTGIIMQLHLAAFFLMARSIINDEKRRLRVLGAAVFSGLLLTAVALLRLKGILLFGVDLGFRLSGTLANPIFFATILLFYLSFALFLVVKSGKVAVKIYYFFSAAVFLAMILATQTRGAVVALGAGIVFFLLSAALGASSSRARRGAILSLFLLSLLPIVFWLNRDTQFVKKTPIINRLANFSDTTASTRLIAWKTAYEAFRQRPVLGWGQENFHLAFNQYYNPALLQYSYYETWWDRPHNIVLEVLAHSGLIGLASYFSILLYAFWQFLRLRLTAGRIMAAGIFAYFVQNLFVFDTPSSLLLFYLLLSGINGKLKVGGSESRETESQISNPKPQTLNPKFLLPILLLASGIMVYKLNWQPMVASSAMLQATVYASDRSDAGRLPLFRQALGLPTPYKEEARVQLSQIAATVFGKKSVLQENFKQTLEFVEKEAKANIALHPRHAYYHFILARIYTEASQYESEYAAKAENEFFKALELSPKRQQIHFGLAKLYVMLGRHDEAREIYRRVLELAPEVGEGHWFYAIMLQEAGDAEAAERELAEAGRLGYMPPRIEERLLIARVMAKKKNFNRVAAYLENVLTQAPERADLHAQLAVAYKELGRFEEARGEAARAAELDPSFKAEAEVFLRLLEENN